MQTLNVDMDALLAAFEYASPEVGYYLDLETGKVVLVTQETLVQLETLYEEFHHLAGGEFDLETALSRRVLPAWRKESLRQAWDVEENYVTRYLDLPQLGAQAGYSDMQAFIQTIEDKTLRQNLWQAVGGKGSFGRFKRELLRYPDQRRRWFKFSHARLRQRALKWLEEQDLVPAPLRAAAPTGARTRLIVETLNFVRAVRKLPGVTRVALIGSLTTSKPDPAGADLLVSIADGADLTRLAAEARKLLGHAQSFNHTAEVYLANAADEYLGRICPWKQCAPKANPDCDALHCGEYPYLHDDLHTVRLCSALIALPPVILWPEVEIGAALPNDLQIGLIAPLRLEQGGAA